jgi:hypothetical protein
MRLERLAPLLVTAVIGCGGADGSAPAPIASTRPMTIPEGTYVTVDTVADFEAGGQFGPDWERTTKFTMRIRHGRWVLTQKPDYPDAGKGGGPFDVDGDVVTLRETRAGGLPPQTARWSYFQGRLSFEEVDISDTGLRVILTAHPWRKVR